MRRTKIIATIGPSTNNYKILKEMVMAGLDVVRLNMSHGTQETHQVVVDIVKKLRDELGIPLPILLDTRGPEIRVGDFENDKVELKKNETFTFTTKNIVGNKEIVSLNQESVIKNLKVGGKILACNGLMTFKITEITKTDIICKVIHGGTLSNHKSIFIPGVDLNIEYLNDLDKADIIWGIKNKIEFISASFINCASDVNSLRNFVLENNGKVEIISKIESKLGIKNIDSIINVSDGIMVARGDLGVELPSEKVPKLQKIMIKKCMSAGKTVITATEMLESMITSPRPTRAETSDVANAIYDGTSAIMLSGETAMGKYPVSAVSTMSKIAIQTEKSIHYKERYNRREFTGSSITDVMSDSVVHASFMLKDLKAIAVYTDTGHTAKMISRFRPIAPIIAFTPNKVTYNRLRIVWGVHPVLCSPCNSADQLISVVNTTMKLERIAKIDEMILIGSGSRKPTSTDMLKIHIVK